MDTPVYFSKIQFTEYSRYWSHAPISRIILNLPARELSLQVFRKKQNRPVVVGEKTEIICGREIRLDINKPAYFIRNEQTDFRPVLLPSEYISEEVILSHGIHVSDEQMKELVPLCNALEYEPFRGKTMNMDDPGYIGYRDEMSMSFEAITDSYIPKIILPMDYYYDEAHIWPQEKLYRHIVKTFFDGNKKLRGWAPTYGGCSLLL